MYDCIGYTERASVLCGTSHVTTKPLCLFKKDSQAESCLSTYKGVNKRSKTSHGRRWCWCCFTSTETVGLLGTGAQDVHLEFHTAPELCICSVVVVEVLLYIQRNRRLIRDGNPGRPPRLSSSSWALRVDVPLVEFLYLAFSCMPWATQAFAVVCVTSLEG